MEEANQPSNPIDTGIEHIKGRVMMMLWMYPNEFTVFLNKFYNKYVPTCPPKFTVTNI